MMRIFKVNFQTVAIALPMLILTTLVSPVDLTAQEVNHVDAEAVRTWLQEGKPFRILDVRSEAEFQFVGHPAGAVNVPLFFWGSLIGMTMNPNFIEDVRQRFSTDETIVVICRGGGRSQRAAEILTEAGFRAVYNFLEGFEGPIGESGLRDVSGWKNSGLPSTYEATPDQEYKPEKEEDPGESGSSL